MPDVLSFASAGKTAFGKMDHGQFTHSLLQQRPRSMAHGHGVQPPIVLADFETRGLAGFNFVQNAIINVLERGADDF